MKTLKNLLLLSTLIPMMAGAQERYGTRSGHITFFSETPMENIEAHNHKVSSVIDPATGAIQFAVLVKAFEFEKSLMQEHFNENYMESNTFPKADLKGTVEGMSAAQYKVPGVYAVTVKGDLTIHGVTRKVVEKGTITVEKSGAVVATSEFKVKPEDHGIAIPGVVRPNIAEHILVKVNMSYDKL